jgi:sulfonate transport system substrate-binding protein
LQFFDLEIAITLVFIVLFNGENFMRILRFISTVAVACVGLMQTAQALSPMPSPMPNKEVITIGYVKVGQVSPLHLVEEELKKMNIEVKRAEFVRYADARTSLISNSVDVSVVGPADLAIAASQGTKNIIGLSGVAASPKYLVVRKGVTINTWDDLKGKKIAVAPGSAVWFAWAMTLVENNIPYNTFTAVNIQGGGTAFVQALKRGDIDAMLSWEPFESQVVAEGAAYFATNLVDYSKSKAVGQELGLLAASGESYSKRREVIKRFMWAYLNAEAKLAADSNAFVNAYSQFTGLPLDVTRESHKLIKLGGVLDRAQVGRLAEASFKQGVIKTDVTKEAMELYDDSLAKEIRGR